MDPTDYQESLTISEVSDFLHVSRGTVARWIRQGRLPAICPPTGKPYRIPKRDFYDFLESYHYTGEPKEKASDEGEDRRPHKEGHE